MAAPSLSQLRWRCRRGMKELDVVLERYCAYLQTLPESEYAPRAETLAKLLKEEDDVFWDWMTGREQAPEHFTDIIHALRNRQH